LILGVPNLTYSEAHELLDKIATIHAALMFHCAKNEIQQIGRRCLILHTLQANEDWNSTPVLDDVAVDANPQPVVNRCNFVTGK
jgi:hypothetical protein